MRIIAGKHKGKRIQPPKGLPVRPTTDMARESLFNILQNYFDLKNLKVLDLFSGTGMVALEFVSRGVAEVVCVDEEAKCIQFIYKIAKEIEAPITPIKQDVFRFLNKNKLQFNVIFADPPYHFSENQYLNMINEVIYKNMLLPDGLLILEHSKSHQFENNPYFLESRHYSSTVFSFFENQSE